MSTIFDLIAHLVEEITQIRGDLVAMEARHERTFRKGKVTDVDADQRKYRQEIGVDDDGNPVKSPWVRYTQVAGDRATHAPPFVGQQMLLISPDGDHEQGVGFPHTFSNDVPSPSKDADKHVDKWGDLTTTHSKDGHIREVGQLKITHTKDSVAFDMNGTTFTFAKSGLDVKGGKLTHDGLDIGSSHKHGGVEPGGGNTDVPEA